MVVKKLDVLFFSAVFDLPIIEMHCRHLIKEKLLIQISQNTL